ncbi:hypothetical protein D3C85_1132840 [compost metagenome]
MISGRLGRWLVARCTSSPNSLSTSSTLASPCCRIKAMASASRRVLMAFSTAPHMGTPKCASNIAGPFGAITATVSPRPIPRLARAEARRMQRL